MTMTTTHFIMQLIAYTSMGLSSMFWMFAKIDLNGIRGGILIKFSVRALGFLGAIWLVLELLKLKY